MPSNLDYQDFLTLKQQQKSTILFKKIINAKYPAVVCFQRLEQIFKKNILLLESVEKGSNKGRFSVIALLPDQIWRCYNNIAEINYHPLQNSNDFIKQEQSSVASLRSFINNAKFDISDLQNKFNYDRTISEGLEISSGIFGYFAYDFINIIENISNVKLDDEIAIPDAIFIRPTITLIFDSLFDSLLICSPAYNINDYDYQLAVDNITKIINIIFDETSNIAISANKNQQNQINQNNINNYQFNFQPNTSKEDYLSIVEKTKKYISSGDIFQIIASQRFTAEFPDFINQFNFYRALRVINPSPFLFYLKFDDFVISGSSPEILVSLQDKKVTIRPLAGTRKIGKNSQEDEFIAKELLNDKKEIAEHLMLIDLGRNDVGRVAKRGSVTLAKNMEIEKYSHVMHISSTVTGEIDNNFDALDALIAGFPAGTVSGAPKIRAMSIIAEIEKFKISFYGGAVGYFASNGNMNSCITLRTALIKNNKIYIQSGAGIVSDSDPIAEYEECINKAQAIFKACDLIKEIIPF